MRIYDKRLSPRHEGARRGDDYDNDSRPHASEEDVVIEMLKDFPDIIAAFVCHGNLTKADYETVLIPAIEEDKLKRHKKLRSYTEIAPDFAGIEPGALWEDTKFGFSHLLDWERSALVTDVEWMKHAAKLYAFLGFLIPGGIRAFPTAEAAKAREWIAENQQ
jgi:SpoIIAA-like